MITLFSRQRASALALGIALATGTATVATLVFPTEANAQRNRDRSEGGGYSAEFRSVYTPLEEVVKDESADLTPYRAQFYQLGGLMNTSDEQYAAGTMIFNAAIRMQDQQLQLLGMEGMLASNKVPIEQIGRFNFIAYQLSSAAGDIGKARTFLQNAINYNFTTDTISAPALQITMAENYFSAGEFEQGFTFFDNAISMQKSRNQEVDERWYRRGLSVAYNNDLNDRVYDLAFQWLADYPNEFSWRETINITRNLNEYETAEILDLLRLSRKVNVLEEEADFEFYVEAADPRRLPLEVNEVIEEGMAAGVISGSNLFIEEALGIARDRIEEDRAELPALEADALAPGAGLNLILAAADTFLSYGQYDKAIGFYEAALEQPDVNTDEENLRLGIAQVGVEDFDAARASFEKVGGNRATIARLWLAYVDQQTKVEAPSLSDLLG
ncbi:MAG: hypothetical protein AAF697_01060 [Pseudomonadota bacterium]